MNRWVRGIVALVALGLIVVGVWRLSPAAAMIVLGGLLLLDLAVEGKRHDPR